MLAGPAQHPFSVSHCAIFAAACAALVCGPLLTGNLAAQTGPVLDLPPPNAVCNPALPQPPRPALSPDLLPDARLPVDFQPWWQPEVMRQLNAPSAAVELTLDSAVVGTLRHSPQVRAMSDTPIIQQASITQASAAFDPRAYMEHQFINSSLPVGNLLTTGGAPRFIDLTWFYNAGFRRLTPTGAQVDVSQRIGYQDNNSIFFVPKEQATTRMALNITQPLLNGSGKAYNSSLIVLAEIDTRIARDQLSKDLQNVLYDVHKAYWDIYLQRAVLLQKRRLYQSALDIVKDLDGRRNVDVLNNQLVRARAAAAMRQAGIIRYQSSVRNAQASLRALVNDPALVDPQVEVVPVQTPNREYLNTDLQDSLVTALQYRPEIRQATGEIKAATVRAEVSKNEVLPVLNLLAGTYVNGLYGNTQFAQSFMQQFTFGRPSYTAGLTFEVPMGNRAALARRQQRLVELRQATNQLQTVMLNVRSEVEIAVREVTTTYREMVSRFQAMDSVRGEIEYLSDRWRLLPGDQQVAGVVLDDLLSAQERLADAEFDFVSAQVAYNVSLINLKRVTGTLLEYEEISEIETVQDNLPTLVLEKNARPPAGEAASDACLSERLPPTGNEKPVGGAPQQARFERLPPVRK